MTVAKKNVFTNEGRVLVLFYYYYIKGISINLELEVLGKQILLGKVKDCKKERKLFYLNSKMNLTLFKLTKYRNILNEM